MNYQAFFEDKKLEIHKCKIFPAPYNEQKNQEFVSFILKNSGKLSISSKEKISSMVIRPKSLNLKYTYDEANIVIDIEKPCNFSVEINGCINSNLLVFASPEREYADNYKNVIRFTAGQQDVGKIKITEDNTAVYFDEGALADGKIEINNCKNVGIFGCGIISERKYDKLPMRICVDVLASEQVVIQDITICESLFWCLRIVSCNGVLIDNVKIIGSRGNNDAIDVCSSKNVTVTNCFTRTWDDSLVVKAIDCHDKTSPHFVFEGSDTDMTAVFEKLGDVENIRFSDCVLWNDFARPIELGVSLRADRVHNIRYENIDIIHSTTGYPLIGAHHGDRAEIYDVMFENIRIEDVPGAQLFDFRITDSEWNLDTKKGCMHDFTFKNIQLVDSPAYIPEMSRLEGFDKEHGISNFTFENIIMCGKAAKNTDEMNLICLDYVDNVVVKADDELPELNMVESKIIADIPTKADNDGKYRFSAKIRLKNLSDSYVRAKVWLAVSPVNVYKNIQIFEYSLNAYEECEYLQALELPAGKYVIRVQSDNVNIKSDWKLLAFDWDITKENNGVKYDFINYYDMKTPYVSLSYTDTALIVESPVLKDNELTLFTAMPVPVSDNEILFTVEETDFGEAMAVEAGKNGVPVIAPQIRCPAEITYVFHNEPKVREIVKTTIPKGEEKAVIPFEQLGVNRKEFLLEITAHTPETKNLRNPYTLFHSVVPQSIAHMFCKVKLK